MMMVAGLRDKEGKIIDVKVELNVKLYFFQLNLLTNRMITW